MGAIHFDKPSEGVVSDNDAIALKIRATGDSTIALQGETEHNRWTDAIVGISKNWVGVHGISNTDHSAVWGESKGEGGHGVWGEATHDNGGAGVYGKSKNSVGVVGVHGVSEGLPGLSNKAGVVGINTVTGPQAQGSAVYGESSDAYGVVGISTYGETEPVKYWAGVKGRGPIGVRGESNRRGFVGVSGEGSIGVVGTANHFTGYPAAAGRFVGDVEVTGDIKLLNPMNADCAEDFDILEETVEPGTVMVLTEDGSLRSSHQEYDKKVAGIISGAGGYKPALILNSQSQFPDENQTKKEEDKNKQRMPISLMGKVFCKVDARESRIEIGDLLTTSSTKGYAMKANDPNKAFGAVIGKALGSIKEGLGMIPVLVTLQ